MDKIIKYYNEFAYPSSQNLYTIMKEAGEKVTSKEVQQVVNEQLASQLHKKQKVKISSHMVAYFENEKWLMDLLDMQIFAGSNKGYRYILIVVDVFTRKGFAIAIKTKGVDDVLNALKEIINKNGKPLKLISDNGKEFLNNKMKNYLNEMDIYHETNELGYHKALGVIDAFSRTMKNKIYKGFTQNDNTKWYEDLDKITKAYNNSPNRAILNLTPNNVTVSKFNNSHAILQLNIWKNSRSKNHKFKIGSIVRKKLKKSSFDKGYKRIWSKQTYTIKDIKGMNGILDNDEIIKLNDLQIISKIPEILDDSENDEIQNIEVEKRIDRRIKKSGIEKYEEVGLKRSNRERKPKQDENYWY